MPKIKEPKLYDKEVLEEYNYPETREMVLHYFSKYRAYSVKVEEICDSYQSSMK